jgi:hypothetical protein
MSTPRLQHRVASATPISVAHLPAHVLKFHKRSVDGSAKCDIVPTRDPTDAVFGVVFQILASEKPILDRYESLGNGYAEKPVAVIQSDGRPMAATAYYATHIDTSLKPYHWYKEHVLRGAREHALPSAHIQAIADIHSTMDPDPDNHTRELSIYSAACKR